MEIRKENRGGRRKNQTGRPKKVRNFSEEIKKDVIGALKRKAKDDGKTFGDLLVESAWGQGHFALKATAMKLIAEILVVKESKQIREEVKKPLLILPETEKPESHGSEVAAPPGTTDEVLRRLAG